MREADLAPAARQWLEERGYSVYLEQFDCDMVGLKGRELVVMELKPCLTEHLWRQMSRRSWWANWVYCVIASEPRKREGKGWFRGLQTMRHDGFGVFQLKDGKLKQLAKARPQPWRQQRSIAYRLKKLTGQLPSLEHEVVGVKACAELKRQRETRDSALRAIQGWMRDNQCSNTANPYQPRCPCYYCRFHRIVTNDPEAVASDKTPRTES